MNTATHTPAVSLKNLPVSLFSSVMGMSGLTLAWRLAARQFHTSPVIPLVIGAVAIAIFALLCIGHAIKAVKYPKTIAHEFNHPIAGNFFGTFNIALLLLASVLFPFNALASQVIWTLGTVLTFVLAFVIIGRLLRGKVDSGHAGPAWLIPGVATLDVAAAGSSMTMPWAHEVVLFSLAVGAVMALVFFTMIVSRLIHHHENMAAGMVPSLMILIAPFVVGFLAYVDFAGHVDAFAAMLFYFGLFLFLILAPKIFRKDVPFTTGWWAVSFPLAALTNASLKYADAVQSWPLTCLAVGLLLFLSAVITILFMRTLRIVVNGDFIRA